MPEAQEQPERVPLSAAFFCPQARAPDEHYLGGLHSFLNHNTHGQVLLGHVSSLKADDTWGVFAAQRQDVSELSQGPSYIDLLHDWATTGTSEALAKVRSGIVALPLLTILQIGQYLRYLDFHQLPHQDFLREVGHAGGGIQGYCGGLPAAIAIACARDEADVVKYTAAILRVLVGIGAYAEAAGESNSEDGCTTLALRLKQEGQGEELVRRFPGTYISAITDPRSISIVGPVDTLDELYHCAQALGLQVQKMEVTGKVHNPENNGLAAELSSLCQKTPGFQLPDASKLQVPVRSNKTGETLFDVDSLTEEVISTILASRCEWFNLLRHVADDLGESEINTNSVVVFGLTDCVPLTPFFQRNVRITKFQAHTLIEPNTPRSSYQLPTLPEDAIAIVGASCRLPGASNLDELWTLLADSTDCSQEIPTDRFNLPKTFRASSQSPFTHSRKFYGNFLSNIKAFDHAFFNITPREAASMDPQQRLLLELSHEALDSSGYFAAESDENIGCFIGASFVEYLDNTNSHAPTAYTSTGTIRAFLCGRISYHYGWSGPAEVIDTACSSSLVAINRACKAIQSGECRMALTGGINLITGVNNYLDLAKAGFLSPTGQCKPFDEKADGYCRSDGAGLLVLKRLRDALADGDMIMGVIPGIATNQGGKSCSITVPEMDAQKKLYHKVLEQGGLEKQMVSYVEAHGTGTQAGDPLEVESVRSVLGGQDRGDGNKLWLGSVKGNIGHCETAAGVAGVLKVLAMLKHGKIPGQANHQRLNPKIPSLEKDAMAIAKGVMDWDLPFRAALVNSYGAAGSNCALVCCEMPGTRKEQMAEGKEHIETVFPFLVSGTSEENLRGNARALATFLRSPSAAGLTAAEIAFTLNHKRQRHKHLASISSSTLQEAAGLLETPLPTFTIASPRPSVLVFSGQTDNKVALDRSFYDSFPIFQSYIDACNAELTKLGFSPLLPAIFQTQPIDDIATLQVGIFAVQYACARSWIDAGLEPQAVVGHSLGELTALCVSGVLCLSDAIKLVATRGRLVATKWGPEKGSMLALNCCARELNDIETLLSTRHSVEIACHNAIESLVAVGSEADIDAVEDLLQAVPSLETVRHQRLKTSHGFHSYLAIPILEELESVAQSLTWNKPRIPLYTCTKEPQISMQDNPRLYISKHAREAVFFYHAVQRIEKDLGPCLWIEAGVDGPIINMTRRASSRSIDHAFQAFKKQGCVVDAVSSMISSLWRSGLFLSHWAFLSPPGSNSTRTPVWMPPSMFQHANHWLDNVDRLIEMQQSLSSRQKSSALPPTAPLQLVTMKQKTFDTAEFTVSTECDRFSKLVRGHMVRLRPLCPASLYMEAAVMAVQLLLPRSSMKDSSLVFENVRFQAPLGASPDGETVLQLAQTGGASSSWSLSLSTASQSLSSKKTSHISGSICLVSCEDSMLSSLQRLLSGSMEKVMREEKGESLRSSRAYNLFSCVVDYDAFFRGIKTITMHENEAVATISLPKDQPGRENSTAWEVCDAVVLDVCIQVAGLLVNTSDAVTREEVAVMVGVDRAVISPKISLQDTMTVYTSFDLTRFVGDVFVLADGGTEVVAAFLGCRFSKVLISKLERSLDAAAGLKGPSMLKMEAPADSSLVSTSSSVTSSGFNTPPSSTSPSDAGLSNHTFETLKELIAECTGADKSAIPHDTVLSELGLDSLASVELIEQLSSKLNLTIDFDGLVESTVESLARRLGPLAPKPSVVFPLLANLTARPSLMCTNYNHPENDVKSLAGHAKLLQILAELSGSRADEIPPSALLCEIGIDSLSVIELQHEVEQAFSVHLNDIVVDSTIQDLITRLSIDTPRPEKPKGISEERAVVRDDLHGAMKSGLAHNPHSVLKITDTGFEDSAGNRGFLGYWSHVAPLQDWLTIAYILEAFASLGVGLQGMAIGQRIPQIQYPVLERYNRLVSRLWHILERHDIVFVNQEQGTIARGNRPLDHFPSSSALIGELESKHPNYKHETALLSLTGPRLADCLIGKTDAVSLMFGSTTSLNIMESYYAQSPMLATMTEQLVIFVLEIVRGAKGPVRILEVGAGTGGTTKRLAEALSGAGVPMQYTFTDISPGLVSKAKTKFRQYPWLEYSTLDLEKAIPEKFKGAFDLVIGTNCVHATTDRRASCARLRETLKTGGVLVLSEVTKEIDWFDVSFGLLDGWWHAEGRTAYPLQPAEWWMETFEKAGFTSVSYSTGKKPEAMTQRLLVGCDGVWEGVPSPLPEGSSVQKSAGSILETMVYKEVGDVQIHADVYFPPRGQKLEAPMPIALMIHGGGHMTLSRKSIRPAQTRHLLDNGFLPVSIDYRLCPEVNLIEGPMADVLSAYQWCKTELPKITERRGFGKVNAARVVVIGWSSGGHLAMSLAWTARESLTEPPTTILSFYAPCNFESGELDKPRLCTIPTGQTSLDKLIENLPRTPITTYHARSSTPAAFNEERDLGWLRHGDPRSDLVLSMFKYGTGLSLLLNGLSSPTTPPERELVQSIDPMSRLMNRGDYAVPTYVIHGTDDEIASFRDASLFVRQMKERNIECGFLEVVGGKHVHDLGVGVGTPEWKAGVGPGYQFLFDIVRRDW